VCEKTRQQTRLRVQHYHQTKDHNITAPFVKTTHNDWTSFQQPGTTNLLNTCLHSERTKVNFAWCIDILCSNTFVEGLETTPNCTRRSVIDDPMLDSGVYNNIGLDTNCKFNFLRVEQPVIYYIVVEVTKRILLSDHH
jgi:hypothetical protein